MAGPPTEPEGLDLRDREAFRRFYDAALPVVYGYFLNRCGGRVDVAQELTQETFMTAVRTSRGEPGVAAPMPWIVSIARRRLVDYYRAQGRERTRHVAMFGAAPPVLPGFSAATPAVDVDVQTALDAVSVNHRAALVLRYVDDLTVAEVGRALGCSERAAESLLVRARSALREAYEGVTGSG